MKVCISNSDPYLYLDLHHEYEGMGLEDEGLNLDLYL